MNKFKMLVVSILLIILTSISYSVNSEDYFGVQSILYSSANTLAFLKGHTYYPKEIANAIGFDTSKNNSIDYYIKLIAKTYDLDINTSPYKTNNFELRTQLDNSINQSNNLISSIIVSYKKNNKEHSANIKGLRANKITTQFYVVNDSALENDDTINVYDFSSEYWKIPINNVYFLSINKNIDLSYSSETNQFIKYLKASQMLYRNSKDFIETPVIENNDVIYQYALKHKNKKLEVRYAFFPYVFDKDENSNNTNSDIKTITVSKDNESFYRSFSMAVALNIAGDENNLLQSSDFQQRDVRSEYFAEWGASYYVKCNSKFGNGYKNAMIVALHKDKIADVYEIFLFDDLKSVLQEFQSQYYSIVFK